jgi:hypothetical protein
MSVKMGAQILSLSAPASSSTQAYDVRLTGSDGIEADDRAAVSTDATRAVVGVVSDPAESTAVTGGPTLLAQALDALERQVTVRPLTLMPDDAKDLAELSALIVDNPPGLTPEMRTALTSWVQRGGVALALLGPRAVETQLGSNLEPFARGRVPWESTSSKGVDPRSAGPFGKEAESLTDLGARARARLAGTEMPGAIVTARWSDTEPWAVELELGMGLVMSVSLPSSPAESDLALRPGLLALLDRALTEASHRSGSRSSVVGTPWVFRADSEVSIQGPRGKVEPISGGEHTGAPSGPLLIATSDLQGRYRVRVDGEEHERIVWIDPDEVTRTSELAKSDPLALTTGNSPVDADISPETALFVLLLFAGEIGLRAFGRWRARRPGQSAPWRGDRATTGQSGEVHPKEPRAGTAA